MLKVFNLIEFATKRFHRLNPLKKRLIPPLRLGSLLVHGGPMKYFLSLVAIALLSTSTFASSFAFTNPSLQVVPLGVSQELEIPLTSTETGSSSPVELVFDRSQLDKVDLAQDIKISVKQTQFILKPGETVKIAVNVTVSASSPSFDLSGVVLKAVSGDSVVAETMIPLSVPALLEIRLYEGHKWSVPKDVVLRSHKNGVTVHFVNYDTKQKHLIHGQGTIPHANTSLEVSKNGAPGGVYEVKVMTTKKAEGLYYCHDHESDVDAKTITFNGL